MQGLELELNNSEIDSYSGIIALNGFSVTDCALVANLLNTHSSLKGSGGRNAPTSQTRCGRALLGKSLAIMTTLDRMWCA